MICKGMLDFISNMLFLDFDVLIKKYDDDDDDVNCELDMSERSSFTYSWTA